MLGIPAVVALLMLQGGPDAANVGLRVVYDTTETAVSSAESRSPGEKVSRSTLTLRITANLLAVREGDEERIYDFASRRVIGLDHAKKQASDWSLHAMAGFAEAELENRKVMARMLEVIGKVGDMADVEMELGMRQDPPAQLELLDPVSLEGGHVIHVLRANQRLRLQQSNEALEEFGLALKANPFLIGPWLDAGQLYYRGYQTVLGWTCWDAARAAAPGSAVLKRVDELEASLRRKHPEYF